MTFQIPHIYNINKLRLFALTAIMAAIMLSLPVAFAEPKKESKAGNKTKREFTLVIDAGHGGHDHGAIDNGAREKNINLGVAKKFAALVRKKLKNVKVVMTRDDDTFVSLQERANIANLNKGNLFVSIHTNSVDKSNPNRKTVSGTSVYALGPQKDANNLKVAQRENAVIELEDNYHQKYSGFDPSKDESYIIFEMAQKKNLGQSLRFADKAQKELVKTASRKDRGVKQAGFWVLWATSMPSVLVELDFICNPTQAAYLNSESGQQELAEALFNAFKKYIEAYYNPTASNDEVPVTDIPELTTETSDDDSFQNDTGISTLVASSKSERAVRKNHISSNNNRENRSSYSRKRRSDNAKKLSDNRNYETESITLKSETDFLAIREKPVEEPKVTVEAPQTEKTSGKKGQKEKASKNNDKKDKTGSKNKNTKKSNSGKKTFIVKNNNSVTASQKQDLKKKPVTGGNKQSGKKTIEKTGIEHASRPVPSGSENKSRMSYTILLLSSKQEIPNDDPAFCGLVPTGHFVENGQHKYYYGQSDSRREIEQKLLEVKTLIPEAFILVRNQ